jgi:hypothetical protein
LPASTRGGDTINAALTVDFSDTVVKHCIISGEPKIIYNIVSLASRTSTTSSPGSGELVHIVPGEPNIHGNLGTVGFLIIDDMAAHAYSEILYI